jgi:hypothetical protein
MVRFSLNMGFVARCAHTVLLTALSTQTTTCLLDRRLGAPGEYLTPLSPPVIVSERGTSPNFITNPLPSEIISAPAPRGEPNFTQRFKVSFLYDIPVPLNVRVYRNRNLDKCFTTGTDTCGVQVKRFEGANALQPTDASPYRIVEFTIEFAPNTCTRIDLYASPRFVVGDPTTDHLPERPGEVAHARWYVAVADPIRGVPPLDECRDR